MGKEMGSADGDLAADIRIVDRLGELERARSRLVFDQLQQVADLLRYRVCERIARDVPQDRWETGIASEVALALRISPHRATRFLARAKLLHQSMPETLERLRAGELSPEAMETIVAGVSHLEPALRAEADRQLCADPAALVGLGLKRLADLVRQVAYRLDGPAMIERIGKAERDRRVTIRPEPDCMARVSILLPMAQGVSVYAALKRAADTAHGVGTEVGSRGQLMADTAYQLLTGRKAADGVPVAVNLTVPATVLLGDEPGTAHLDGGGVLPAEIARNLVGKATAGAVAWVKRLYVAPDSGAVVGLDSRRRHFPAGLAEVIAARDRYCRTPYCDAPIAHTDHITPHASGGATSFTNGQGLCAACNYAKQADGWTATTSDSTGRHTVDTTHPPATPTAPPHRRTPRRPGGEVFDTK